ncbi:MAG: hypothetical protein AABX66_01165 [Nanoarchaeota archaeon]
MEINETEKILIQNAREYYEIGLDAEKKKNYNSAITLYFKALAVFCDLLILKKIGKIPSSHSERFRILETLDKEIYELVDRDFTFYQNSYRARLGLDACSIIHDDVRRISEKIGIKI